MGVELRLVALATLGSVLALAGAFWFQHVIGLAPCPLCIWQRWPHAAGVAAGAAALVLARGPVFGLAALAGALAMLAGTGIALYHTGVESGWWPGPASCALGDVSGLDPDALLDRILAAPIVRCDEVAWAFLGLSMATWNGLMSLVLAALWARAALGRGVRA
ncbi:MAG: disulfide bond formation protein B [Rhodobacteraceae bacterium]|nr:disulfide bond formation protein B [Paracoccaceae bacterium]